jgi:hypothetical protein
MNTPRVTVQIKINVAPCIFYIAVIVIMFI